MSVYYIASLKINYLIGQNLGNKAKPRDHDPLGTFVPKSTLGTRLATPLIVLQPLKLKIQNAGKIDAIQQRFCSSCKISKFMPRFAVR